MKIKSENFWENIGEIIYVPKDIKWDGDDETINLKAGTYQIVEIKEHGNLFLDIKNNKLVNSEPITGLEFANLVTPPEERLELLEDAFTKQVLMLSSEGWTELEDPTEFDLDITPTLLKLKTIQLMRKRDA